MKWTYATLGIMILGIIGISIIMLFQQLTTSNENDYYLLKEITEAAMIDSIDITNYRKNGELKIIREKFVENFTRRFTESTSFKGTDYKIEFYDIMEKPPKVSIKISTTTKDYKIYNYSDDYTIMNKLDGILEYVDSNSFTTLGDNPYKNKKEEFEYTFITNKNDDGYLSVRIPDKLVAENIKNVKIDDIKLISKVDKNDFYQSLISQKIYYNNYSSNIENFYDIDYSDIKATNNLSEFKYCNYEFKNNCSGKCNCDGISGNENNKYWIKIKKNSNKKENLLVKYTIKWSYDEYEFK